jgi:hypothetical protein
MTSVKSTKKENQDECVELKNIKYQTMLLNNKTNLAPNNIDNISNIDSFLDNEKKTNEKKPWSKLSSALKLKKIQLFIEIYSETNKLTSNEKKKLFMYLNTQLQRKKLQRIKDVIYDSEKGIIKDIIGLTYNKTNLKFTIKNKDKPSGTLKNLAPKTRKQKKHKNKKNRDKDKSKTKDNKKKEKN